MAAKHGNGSENRDAGTAASGVPGAPIDGISERELIDSAGSRETIGAGFDIGDEIGGDGNSGADSGSARESGGRNGGASAEGSGESEGTAAGTRKRTRTRNRSRSAGRSASGAASEETRHTGDDFSRPIEPPKRPKVESEIEIPSANAEIIGDVFAFAFWGIGQATGIPEWELPTDDAEVIGKNGEKWLKSLGKKRSQALMKGLSKLGPSLAFFGSLGMALVPRVKLTIQSAKHGAIKPIQERTATRNGGNPSQPVASVRPETSGNVSDIGGPGERSRPFASEDFSEVTQGFAGLDDGLPIS